MLSSEKIGNEMYQSLGKLFYAIAMADHSVHTKELDTLRRLVREYWLDVDEIEDEYGTDAAFQIESVFDWLLEYEKEAKTCFEEFADFYKEHPKKFTPAIRRLILGTADAIASSFAGKNKSELILLAKLRILLG